MFQSLPDSWAIGQLFPIMPIQRLGEKPMRKAVLADITCDSDGKIDRFVHPRATKRTLEVHELVPDEPYYLAAFLVGAYQETLGDLHNLFGDTHVVHIRLHEGGGWGIEEIVKGDTTNKVLEYMEYDTDELYPPSPGTASGPSRKAGCRSAKPRRSNASTNMNSTATPISRSNSRANRGICRLYLAFANNIPLA